MRKHILPLLLCLIMVLSLMPTTALAGTSIIVPYIDENGNPATASDVIEVTSASSTWEHDWYIASGTDVTIAGQVSVNSDVHLILADNCTLTVNKGIAINANGSLTIYAQSTSTDMGELNVLYTKGANTLTGAIYCNDSSLTIVGGKVNVSATNASGMCHQLPRGKIQISGGEINITATGTNAHGIQCSSNNSGIDITGGKVTITSSGNGILNNTNRATLISGTDLTIAALNSAVHSDTGLTIQSSDVSASGNYGIASNFGIEINYSTVTATSISAGGDSLTIKNSNVTAINSLDKELSISIGGSSGVVIEDSTVYAQGQRAGVRSGAGSVKVARSTLVATCSNAENNFAAIYGSTGIEIAGGAAIRAYNGAEGGKAFGHSDSGGVVTFTDAYSNPLARTVMVSSTTDADATTWDEETLLTTYKYVRIAPPAPTPAPTPSAMPTHGGTPIYYWSNQNPQPESTPTLPDVDTSAGALRNGPASIDKSVWLTGEGLANNDLLITAPLSDTAAAVLIKNTLGEVIGAYDISLASGKTTTGNALTLHFDVGEKYAGQSFTLLHQKADGTVETFTAIADEKGIVSFGPIYELSPFVLIMNKSKAADNEEPPQTGDSFTAVGFIMIVAALAIAAVVAVKRKNAKRVSV